MRNTYKTIVESLEVCWDHQLAFLFCFLSCIFLLFYQSIEPFQFFLVYATSLFSKKNYGINSCAFHINWCNFYPAGHKVCCTCTPDIVWSSWWTLQISQGKLSIPSLIEDMQVQEWIYSQGELYAMQSNFLIGNMVQILHNGLYKQGEL